VGVVAIVVDIIAVGVDVIGVGIIMAITAITTVIMAITRVIMVITAIIITVIILAGANWFIARSLTTGCVLLLIKHIRYEWFHKTGVVLNFSGFEMDVPRLSVNQS
jgi:hypothetical protein